MNARCALTMKKRYNIFLETVGYPN